MQQEIEKQRELETANRLAKLNVDSKHDDSVTVEPSEQLDKNEVNVMDLNKDVKLQSDENSDSNIESTHAKKRIKIENDDFKFERENIYKDLTVFNIFWGLPPVRSFP